MDKVATLVDDALGKQSLIVLVLSDARKQDDEDYRKVLVKPILLRGERRYQFEYHYPRKVTHRNLAPDEARDHVCALLAEKFRQGQFYTEEADFQVSINKQGRTTVITGPPSKRATDQRHDRKKNYLLPENQPCDFLIRLGVMSETGKVIVAKYDKFRQINRFLEMVTDVVDHLPPKEPLRVVDFGCGKSYLTFALYYYLRVLQKRRVQIVGLDLKRDVISHCKEIARDLRYDDLQFVVGDIQGYEARDPVDMVVTLHACDTATDDALAKAVAWDAAVILSVPCCQHELFGQIRNVTLRPMLKHGIVKERLAALITDSLRAALLETCGYSVQMLEFIETEHTPKNILIRAVKQPNKVDRERLVQEYLALRDFWQIRPYIEEAFRSTGAME